MSVVDLFRPETVRPLPQRVLMTADCVGGVWQYALELSAHLSSEGVDVVLAVMGANLSNKQIEEVKPLEGVTVHCAPFRLEWMLTRDNDCDSSAQWLLSLRDRYRPNLVHLNHYAHTCLPWGVPTLQVAHSCVLSWWDAVYRASPAGEWDEYRRTVREAVSACDLLVAPTQTMLSSMRNFYGTAVPGRVIHNARTHLPAKARRDPQLIFAAGRVWDRAKNFEILEQAAQIGESPIFLAGPLQNAQEKADFPHLRLLGELSSHETQSWMAKAGVFAHPSVYEPFGLCVLEAAQAGCALVLSDIPSLRELWDGSALFVDPHDACAWAEALKRSRRSAEQHRLSQLAIHRAMAYGPASMTKAYLTAYSDLMKTHHDRRFECAS